jgi:hypothetical protein
LKLNLVIAATLIVFWSADYFYWIPTYHYSHIIRNDKTESFVVNRVEDFRRLVFTTLYAKLDVLSRRRPNLSAVQPPRDNPLRFYRIDPDGKIQMLDQDMIEPLSTYKNDVRVIYIGASQAWGVGAADVNKSVISKFHSNLLKKWNRPVQTLALASPGRSITELSKYYFANQKTWRPDILILHISLRENDNQDAFYQEILKISKDAHRIGVQMFIVQEPEDVRPLSRRVQETRFLLGKVSLETKTPVIDAQIVADNTQMSDGGLMWWDSSHFDDFGHAIIGGFIADQLANPLKVRIDHGRSRATER